MVNYKERHTTALCVFKTPNRGDAEACCEFQKTISSLSFMIIAHFSVN